MEKHSNFQHLLSIHSFTRSFGGVVWPQILFYRNFIFHFPVLSGARAHYAFCPTPYQSQAPRTNMHTYCCACLYNFMCPTSRFESNRDRYCDSKIELFNYTNSSRVPASQLDSELILGCGTMHIRKNLLHAGCFQSLLKLCTRFT